MQAPKDLNFRNHKFKRYVVLDEANSKKTLWLMMYRTCTEAIFYKQLTDKQRKSQVQNRNRRSWEYEFQILYGEKLTQIY